MISDNIKNCERYFSLNKDFEKVFGFLKTVTDETPDGRYDISDTAYVNVSTSTLEPCGDRRYELHGVYADIQYMSHGLERIDIASDECIAVTEDRMATDDFAFTVEADKYTSVMMGNGDFAVIYPGEAHKPLISPDGKKSAVKKAVGKVKV